MSNILSDTVGSALGIAAEALGAKLPPLLVATQRVAETVSPGAHGRRRVGQGESFWQFRPYTAGDTIDRIDWRQSAKGDKLYLRETEWAAAQSIWLWCDPGPGMDYRSDRRLPTKRHRGELLLMALAALLLRGGERVALLGGGRRPSSGKGALSTLLAGLPNPVPLTSACHSVPRHATLILLSDFLDPIDDIARRLDQIAVARVAAELVQILDPAELSLSFKGRVRFRDVQDAAAEELLIPRVEAIRPAYLDALQRQQNALADMARTRGWNFMIHGTDAAPEEPLKALYAHLENRA